MNNIDPIQNNPSPTDDNSQNSHTDINNNNLPISNNSLPISTTDKKKYGKKLSKYSRLSESQKLIIKSKIASNIPITQIAKEESISPQTIYNVVNKSDMPVLENKQLDKLQKSIISHAYANAFQATKSVTQEKIDSSSLVQIGVFSKISVELARLLQEKSTSNIAVHNLNENINDELENLRRKITNLDNNPLDIASSPSKRMINNPDNNNETNPIEIKDISEKNQKE